MMIMQDIVQAISTVGFPIAITLYIIIRLEGCIKENTKATQENNALIRELKILVERLNGK